MEGRASEDGRHGGTGGEGRGLGEWDAAAASTEARPAAGCRQPVTGACGERSARVSRSHHGKRSRHLGGTDTFGGDGQVCDRDVVTGHACTRASALPGRTHHVRVLRTSHTAKLCGGRGTDPTLSETALLYKSPGEAGDLHGTPGCLGCWARGCDPLGEVWRRRTRARALFGRCRSF